MSAPNLANLPQRLWTVALPTGRVIDLDAVRHAGGESFTYGYLQVGDYLSQQQRLAFPTYDPTDANRRASDARLAADGRKATDGSTNTLALFVEGVARDLSPNEPGVASTIARLIYVAAGVAALWIGWQILKAMTGAR